MHLPYIPPGWGITGIVVLFIIAGSLFLRKKKISKGAYVVIGVFLLFIASALYSNAGTEVYIIDQELQATKTEIHGKTEMKLKFFTYHLDPVPGNVMVINRSLIPLYIKQVCYAEPVGKWKIITINSGEAKNIPVSSISYFPKDVPPRVQTFTVGSSEIQYQVSKDSL
jgi:hypothetical protein